MPCFVALFTKPVLPRNIVRFFLFGGPGRLAALTGLLLLLTHRQADELLPALADFGPARDPILHAFNIYRTAQVRVLFLGLLVVFKQGATVSIVVLRHSFAFLRVERTLESN